MPKHRVVFIRLELWHKYISYSKNKQTEMFLLFYLFYINLIRKMFKALLNEFCFLWYRKRSFFKLASLILADRWYHHLGRVTSCRVTWSSHPAMWFTDLMSQRSSWCYRFNETVFFEKTEANVLSFSFPFSWKSSMNFPCFSLLRASCSFILCGRTPVGSDVLRNLLTSFCSCNNV